MGVMNERFWSGGFLHNPKTDAVLLHHRDGNTKINPNKWAFFGGLNEGGEDPTGCFIRELHEELGLLLERPQVIPLRSYLNEQLNTFRNVFYSKSEIEKSELILGEGAGFDWIPLDDILRYDLTEMTRNDLLFFSGLIGQKH